MICPNCGKETKGLKLNGKLFCSYCGDVIKNAAEILEESYQTLAEKPEKELSTETKLTHNTEKTIDTRDKPTVKKSQKIKKHDRARADHHYELLDNEPDPIKEPELDAPHDIMVTAPAAEGKAEKPSYSLLTKEEKKSIHDQRKKKQEILTNYLRQTATVSAASKPKKKKKTSKKIRRGSLIWGASAFLVLMLIGLILYVNNLAVREDRIRQKVESMVQFTYQKPAEPPEGYKLSYLSDAGDNFIIYHYIFSNDRERFISVKIEPTEIQDTDVLEKILTQPGVGFDQIESGGLQFWQTELDQIFVIKDGLLYSFEQSGELHSSDFLNYAKETLI